MLQIAQKFCTDGIVTSCKPYGGGLINATYLAETCRARYILQKINKAVFKDPPRLMQNIELVTRHMQSKNAQSLTLVPCADGAMWFVDDNGDVWRMFNFIEHSLSIESTASLKIMHASGTAFGDFINIFADFDATKLAVTIPDFHNTPARYKQLHDAIAADALGRVAHVSREIDFALAREDFAPLLMNLQASGDMPARVTHNDTKLGNVLFHEETGNPLCVIDLDTAMPGLAVTDFGDGIRSGAKTAAEDAFNLNNVNFSLPLYHAFRDGFLAACTTLNACEIAHLPHGAKMMTLECGVRFLTDYLNGDVYFRTNRAAQNFDRCRTQFKLVHDMEQRWDKM